jgi:hypothetical protein
MLNNIAALNGAGIAVAGDYESIQTVNVGAGGQASISFTSIPSTYKHLQLRGINRSTGAATYGTNDVVLLRLNSDSGTNYSSHYLVGGDNGSTTFASGGSGQTYFNMGWNASSSTGANVFSTSITDILDYTSANKNKTLRMLEGYETNGANGFGNNCIWYGSGAWYNSSTAISTITLTYSGGGNFAQYSSFALYGIK